MAERQDKINILIYKNKRKIVEMTNRRGIFLTNIIIEKIFEKVILEEQRGKITVSMFQNGGRKKNRSTKDNWLGIMAIMDMDTYMVFADAEKCFDKLWLEDFIVDLVEAGMIEREAMMVYIMNEQARIIVEHPMERQKK